MNHFITDKRYFANQYAKYGVIPIDKDLPYKASNSSACGKYVHPEDDIKQEENKNNMENDKQIVRFNESQLHKIIKESLKRVLREGTTFEDSIIKWNSIKDNIGAEEMLDCIFNWSSSDMIDQYIQWFEKEGYLDK